METLFSAILSQSGIVALLFVFMLLWTYKLAKWFLWKYLDLSQEHNTSFLKSFDKMVTKVWDLADNVIEWNKSHSQEHDKIMTTLDTKHKNNALQHDKMIQRIEENTDNIKLTHISLEKLNEKISTK